ncbi:MAG: PspC domain-containing protein [Bacteroides sp.]|nr:PspC domain-containing protein [Bacteroides sp.]
MKKTLTVNLGGTVYHIDEDAYRLLDNYLNNLHGYFRRQEGGQEIVNDMEGRIAELFSEKLLLGRSQVITITDVEEIIARMGHPEELAGEQKREEREQDSPFSSASRGAARKLYRNPDDKLLGGVISGIAAYFGWDATLLRILFILLMLGSGGTCVLIYMILWIIVPEARTAEEKLHMRGEDITLENIGKTVTDGFEKVAEDVGDFVRSDKPRNFFLRLGDALMSIIGWCAKAFLIFMAVVLSPVFFALAITFFALLVAAIGVLIGGGSFVIGMLPGWDWTFVSTAPMVALVGSLAGILLVGIPVGSLVCIILQQIFHWKPMATGLKWTLVILWLVSLVTMFLCVGHAGWEYFPWENVDASLFTI